MCLRRGQSSRLQSEFEVRSVWPKANVWRRVTLDWYAIHWSPEQFDSLLIQSLPYGEAVLPPVKNVAKTQPILSFFCSSLHDTVKSTSELLESNHHWAPIKKLPMLNTPRSLGVRYNGSTNRSEKKSIWHADHFVGIPNLRKPRCRSRRLL